MRLPAEMNKQFMKLAYVRPSMQRLAIGITALGLQTEIDANNPYVDENTRKHSAVRTAAKMTITSTSGFIAREIGQRVGESIALDTNIKIPDGIMEYARKNAAKPNYVLTEIDDKGMLNRLIRKNMLDSRVLTQRLKELGSEVENRTINTVARAKYAKAVGAVAAIGSAIISIFSVDMTLTDPLTNKVLSFLYKNPEQVHKTGKGG